MRFNCQICAFADYRDAIRYVRETVFVLEQKVPIELEWDGLDETAVHAVAIDEHKNIVATGRLILGEDENGARVAHIGRMAVLEKCRRRKVGTGILALLCKHAKSLAVDNIFLNAQLVAVPFYESQRFYTVGDTFIEAGILHLKMQLKSNNNHD